jgi:hypothetical protein
MTPPLHSLADLAKRIGLDMNYCAVAAQTGRLTEFVRMGVQDYGASNVVGRALSGKGVERAGEAYTRITGVDVETGRKKRGKNA